MEKLAQKIESLVTSLGYYLYDVEYVKENDEWVLRVMIENDTSIDLDDCVTVSRALNDMFDEDDPFENPYNLEVTSPGAERILHTSEQINRAVGKHVYVETVEQKFTGKLVSYREGELELDLGKKVTTKVNDMDIDLIRLAIVL